MRGYRCLQSQLSPYPVRVGGKEISVGGLERVAALSRKAPKEVDGALLGSTGDDLMGAICDVFKGEAEMRAMSAAGYDVVRPGNHEFDLGVDVYRQALQFARFDVVSANLKAADERQLVRNVHTSDSPETCREELHQ